MNLKLKQSLMIEKKRENQEVLRWYFSEEPQLTESIKRLLVLDDDGEII